MQKVALYPFNKITQGLIRFRDLLDFEICSVLDFVLCTGNDAGERVDGKISGIAITDDAEEALKDIDTLILNDPGTTFAGNEKLFAENNLVQKWRKLIIRANEKGIRVISVHEIFDRDTKAWIKDNNISIDIGKKMDRQLLDNLDVLDVAGDNLHREIHEYIKSIEIDGTSIHPRKNIKKIAVMATHGCLGKFTTQMSLYRELKKTGKKVTALITEPTGFLFNQFDADMPKFMAEKPWSKYPYYINELVKKAEADGYEYIILSGQGSLTPNKHIRLDITKISMLEAFDPDINLLVAGYGDDGDVHDSIELLRIYASHAPLAILIPDKVEREYGEYSYKTPEQIDARKKELRGKFGIPHVELIKNISEIAKVIAAG